MRLEKETYMKILDFPGKIRDFWPGLVLLERERERERVGNEAEEREKERRWEYIIRTGGEAHVSDVRSGRQLSVAAGISPRCAVGTTCPI